MSTRNRLPRCSPIPAVHWACAELALVLLMCLAAGCVYTPEGDLPPCQADDLVAPTNLSPGQGRVITSRTPELDRLSWDYPGECQPSGYKVEVYIPAEVFAEAGYRGTVDGYHQYFMIGHLDLGEMYTWHVSAMSDTIVGPASTTEVFFTGPICSSADRASYQSPQLLRPLDGDVITSTITIHGSDGTDFTSVNVPMEWEDETACLPPEGYAVEVSRDPTFPLEHGRTTVIGPSVYFLTANFYFPPGTEWHDCERYYWRVLTGWPLTSSGGTPEEPYSQVYGISDARSFVINTAGILCPPDLGPIVPPVSPLHSPPETTPVAGTPLANVNQAANCRSGPGMDYPVLDILPQGASLAINGRNRAGGWWQVDDTRLNINCWLAKNVVEVSGDVESVPEVQVAPPPEQVPTDTSVPPANCAQYNANTCPVHPACQWDQKSASCKNK